MAIQEVDQEQSAEAWRKHIAAAALKVFRSRGLVGAKTREIAEEAQVKESLLWTYFESKDEIFELAVLDVLESNVAQMLGKIDFRGIEDEESRAVVFAKTQESALTLMREITPLLGVVIFSRPEMGRIFHEERLLPLFVQWSEDTGWAAHDWPRLAADWWTAVRLIWGAQFGIALDAYIYQRDFDAKQAGEQMAGLLSYGAVAQAARRPARRSRRSKDEPAQATTAPASSYGVVDGTATITLGRSASGEALSVEVLNALNDDFVRADEDATVQVIVLTGSEDAFSRIDDQSGSAVDRILKRIRASRKPVICRITGACTGVGVKLAEACDVAFMGDELQFALEVRTGKVPQPVAVVTLPKKPGAKAPARPARPRSAR